MPVDFGVGGAHRFDVLQQAFRREAAGDRLALGMVGDRDGVEAAALGFEGQLADGQPAVRGGGVGVQLGADVLHRRSACSAPTSSSPRSSRRSGSM